MFPSLGFGSLVLLSIVTVASLFLGLRSSPIGQDRRLLELDFLRHVMKFLPAVVWSEKNGNIEFENQSHEDIAKTFEIKAKIQDFNLSKPIAADGSPVRASLESNNSEKVQHYDIYCIDNDPIKTYFAVSAEAAVKAEKDRRRFVQTLSDSFAHLDIGVAVFDKERDLSLFNPALGSLLDVEPSWLAQRPSLRDFLDHLHAKGALPEPRNFKSWREQFTEMESSAIADKYTDDWHMPNDRILHVKGRSHPVGAVAFLFEDITKTMAIERDYRLELLRNYQVLDILNTALAVFDRNGKLTLVNRAFDDLWQTEFADKLLSPNIVEITELWQDKCKPSPIWGEIRNFSSEQLEREPFNGSVMRNNDQVLQVQISALVEGGTLVEFCEPAL